MDIKSSRSKLLVLGPFLSVVIMITIAAVPMVQKALKLHIAQLHAKKNANCY